MKVIIYGTPSCTFCKQAISLAEQLGGTSEYKTVGQDIQKEQLEEMIGHTIRSVPQIFINVDGFTEYVGGFKEFKAKMTGEAK